MKISAKALAAVCAVIWGGALFLVGLANMLFPSYGADFLKMMASIYPGYSGAPHFGSLLIGTVWALVDGCVGGYLVAWLYNSVQAHLSPSANTTA